MILKRSLHVYHLSSGGHFRPAAEYQMAEEEEEPQEYEDSLEEYAKANPNSPEGRRYLSLGPDEWRRLRRQSIKQSADAAVNSGMLVQPAWPIRKRTRTSPRPVDADYHRNPVADRQSSPWRKLLAIGAVVCAASILWLALDARAHRFVLIQSGDGLFIGLGLIGACCALAAALWKD